MARKATKKNLSKKVVAIAGNHFVTESGDKILAPTLAQLRKKYGSLVDGMDYPRKNLAQAKIALKYGCRVTTCDDGLVGIHGWEWNAQLPIQLSAVQGMNKVVQKQAIAMMNDSGFMGRNEPQSSNGLLEGEAQKLYR